MSETAKFLMIAGGSIFLVGLLLLAIGRVPGIGQLPGDIQFQRGNFSVHLPLGSMIVLSIVLTIVLNLVVRLWR